jgi:4-amino-4-deoxy-L-arabinose transferase-like glycosyltransferase
MGWPIVFPCACTTIWLLWRRRLHPLSSVEIVFFGWIGLYLAVLLAPFHEMLFHYTLPMIPPAAILGARGIVAACETIERRTHLDRRVPAGVTAMAVVLLSVVPGTGALMARRDKSLHRMDAANIVVGDWLSNRLPASSSIAYDSLTYIPPRFTNIIDTWGGTRAWLAKSNPDVVVVNRAIENSWANNPGSEDYYRCLQNETCGYERVFELNEVSVYQREACGGPVDFDAVFGSNDTR